MTPLHWAAYEGYKDVVALLLASMAAVNAEDNNRDTPSDLAAKNSHKDVLGLLGQHGGLPHNPTRPSPKAAGLPVAAPSTLHAQVAKSRLAAAKADECSALGLRSEHFSKVAVWIIDDFKTQFSSDRSLLDADAVGHGGIVSLIVRSHFDGAIHTTNAGGYIADEQLNGWDITQGLRSIISFAVKNPDTAVVVNMSWGTSERSPALGTLFGTLSGCGLVFVAAAGNDGRAYCSFPAGYQGVIGVGSIDNTHNRARYSNYGECVQVAVMEDTWPLNWLLPLGHGLDEYDSSDVMQRTRLAGTSFAAAHVTGIIAQMLARDPAHSLTAPVERLQSDEFAFGFYGDVKMLSGRSRRGL